MGMIIKFELTVGNYDQILQRTWILFHLIIYRYVIFNFIRR